MLLLTFSFSLPPIFTLLAASISRSCFHTAIKCLRFSSKEIGLLCLFLSLSSPFLGIHVNVDIKTQSKERIGFVVVVFFLSSKSPGGHAIHGRNALVLEMQNFIPSCMNGRTYVRTILSEPKFLGFIDNQLFYPRWSATRVLRALELHY